MIKYKPHKIHVKRVAGVVVSGLFGLAGIILAIIGHIVGPVNNIYWQASLVCLMLMVLVYLGNFVWLLDESLEDLKHGRRIRYGRRKQDIVKIEEDKGDET